MGEQPWSIPLADGLSCTLDATKEHPERYATIIGGAAPLPLNKVQALALFQIMLSHLMQLAGDELHNDPLLQQVDLVQTFHDSIDWPDGWSDTDLQNPQILKEALEQYYFAYDIQGDLMTRVRGWETMLQNLYDRMESAASTIGVDLEELLDEDETTE
jgi:hypothetical protein